MSARRLLLVEDEPGNHLTLSALLEDEGYEVVVAETFAEAEARLGEAAYAAMLLDRGLGGRDGLELIPLARARWANLPVVVVSGDPGAANDADAVWEKGSPFEELLATLGRLVD